MFTYFTELVKRDVVDRHERWLGHPYDFFANLDESYPSITTLIVATGTINKKYYIIPWDQVSARNGNFFIKKPLEQLELADKYFSADKLSLRKAILDQQVVDTYHRKVVRVNDLHFLRVDNSYRLAHVDVGVRGLVRRLGWERYVDGVVRFFHPHARYLVRSRFIAWKFVQPLSMKDSSGRIQLRVEQSELSQIPPSDISEMLMDLDTYQRAALLRSLDTARQVEILTELDIKWQKDLIEELDTRTAVELIERMPADEATDLLSALAKKDANRILNQLSSRKAREIRELMEHESDSAGGLMTTEFITLTPNMTVGEAIRVIKEGELRKVKSETIHVAYVVDPDGRLIGAINFRKLLIEPSDLTIGHIMQIKPPVAHVENSLKDVSYLFDKYNLFVLPVVDDEDMLEGIITVDDVLSLILEEAWGTKAGL